jgi:hypothetical protein
LINNRQAGRRRGRNNNPRQTGGGGNRGNGDSGNRIDNRARGNAAQLLEKYRNLARDAQMAGDRVNAEYYLQFADHYFRVLADNRARQEEQQQRFRRNDDSDQDGDDQDDQFDSMGDEVDEFAPPPMQEQRPPRRERDRDRDGNRGEATREGNRSEGNRGEGARAESNRSESNRSEGNRTRERTERTERSKPERRQPVANDDGDGDIGLPSLPPSIGRIEASDEDETEAPRAVEAPEDVAAEPAPKPRRGRRPRQPEAAE